MPPIDTRIRNVNALNSVRAGGIAGIAFVVGLVVVGFLAPPPPEANDPAAKYLDYLLDNRSLLMVQASLSIVLAAPLLLFAPSLWSTLASKVQGNRTLATAAAAGLLLGWASGSLLALLFGGLAYLSETTLDANSARNLMVLVNVGYGSAVFFWGMATLASGLVLTSETGWERWLGWSGVLVALISTAVQFTWADSGAFAPGFALFVGYLLSMVYFLALSVVLVRAPRTA